MRTERASPILAFANSEAELFLLPYNERDDLKGLMHQIRQAWKWMVWLTLASVRSAVGNRNVKSTLNFLLKFKLSQQSCSTMTAVALDSRCVQNCMQHSTVYIFCTHNDLYGQQYYYTDTAELYVPSPPFPTVIVCITLVCNFLNGGNACSFVICVTLENCQKKMSQFWKFQ